MDIFERRELLSTQTNPDVTIDYLVSLDGQIEQVRNSPIGVKIFYVPDRQILNKTSLIDYLEGVGDEIFPSMEHAGIVLLNDFSNELVPRWLMITLSQNINVGGYSQRHEIRLQDRQPNWSNSQLLSSISQ